MTSICPLYAMYCVRCHIPILNKNNCVQTYVRAEYAGNKFSTSAASVGKRYDDSHLRVDYDQPTGIRRETQRMTAYATIQRLFCTEIRVDCVRNGRFCLCSVFFCFVCVSTGGHAQVRIRSIQTTVVIHHTIIH